MGRNASVRAYIDLPSGVQVKKALDSDTGADQSTGLRANQPVSLLKALFRSLPNDLLRVIVHWKAEGPPEVDSLELERVDVLEQVSIKLLSALLPPGNENRPHSARPPGLRLRRFPTPRSLSSPRAFRNRSIGLQPVLVVGGAEGDEAVRILKIRKGLARRCSSMVAVGCEA
jgi:hypothetical protein